MFHGDLLGERTRLTPDKTALVYVPTGERLSYAQLNERAIRCARYWTDTLRLKPGDRVGVLSPNRVEVLDAFFAAAKTGIIFVPLGTRLIPAELAAIARDAGLAALMYDPTLAGTVVELQQHASLPAVVAFDDYLRAAAMLNADRFERARVSPEDVLVLLYTSGTTGQPKGVMIPHRQVVWNGYNSVACWGLREDDVSPVYTPLYHAGGLFAFLIPIFAIGGTIVLHAGFDTGEVWRTIERERCTVILGVPTIWKMLLEAPEFHTVDLSHVRICFSGGAPLPLYIIEAYQARGIVFKQGFGMTEVGVNCFSMTNEESVRKRGTIGKPLMFTETRIVAGDGEECAPGEVGELWIRGPHVCRGYWNNPEATAAALDRDGWFHTGDLATRDAEGFHTIAGRKKDMIISGGVNIYPAEIEGHLLLHPGVRDGAVVGVPDPTWGEAGVAFIVADPAQPPSPESLETHLRARLARFKVPRDFVFVDALPRTASGKVVKGELRDTYVARRRERADG